MQRRHLIASRTGRAGDDPIFALNQEANARKARGETVLNATLGALLDDEGALAILPTAARAIREVPPVDWAGYAPIAGPAPFLKAVIADACATRPHLAALATAVASPGGSGALRHAIASFLEPGQALLTTSFYWGPYDTIADENERRVAPFRMFADDGAFDAGALDEALSTSFREQGRALVIVNDPCHNPTGYSMDERDWRATAEVLARHAGSGPLTVTLDAAYSAYGPTGGIGAPLAALEPLLDRLLVTIAWSASKAFTHYGLRVGALVAITPDAAERTELAAALTYACRGTWSNCNRGGMAAVTRLLTDPALRAQVTTERDALRQLLNGRVAAFNEASRRHGLRHPRYDGGFFTTVFCDDARASAAALRERGVYVVPIEGALRLGLCAVRATDVPRLVEAVAGSL